MNSINETINEMAKNQTKEIDKAIISFLEKNGYKNITVDYIKELVKKWEKEGKQLRCEVFYTNMQVEDYLVKQECIIIPFFDLIPSRITRNDVYKMYNLENKGYIC